MPLFQVLPFAAAALAILLAAASVLRKTPSAATWCFSAGMVVLAVDSLCTGLSLHARLASDFLRWLTWGVIAKSFLPATWLGFSLTYSRGDYRGSLARWRFALAAFTVLPIALAVGFQGRLFELEPVGAPADALLLRATPGARALHVMLLVAFVLALMNLEQTFRAAVGTMRWRIKFVVLGLAVIFGAQIYVQSQAILYSAHDMALAFIESSGLLVGGLFLVLAYARTGFAEIDVYPSRAVLRSSLTVLIVGGYLFSVGVLAQIVRRVGGAESLQFQALIVLLGMAGLAVLLLSDRLRQRIHAFVGRHFRKAQHDSVRVWTEVSRQMANVQDRQGLCATSSRLIASTFDVLSVTVWLIDETGGPLVSAAATSRRADGSRVEHGQHPIPSQDVADALQRHAAPVDLDVVDAPWADTMRQLNPTTFAQGGHRWCVPLRSGADVLGAVVLADRVNGALYTVEELELLQCIADQMASALVNLRLADEVARGRELDAFRTMSAFFVHDLKNAAASLNLMLKNLPAHFDDPAFRADALRAVGNTARRIDEMIARLSALRQSPDVTRAAVDLNQLVSTALDGLDRLPDVELTTDLQPVPEILVDREQILSVATNLLLNARDAVGQGGRIQVRTDDRGGRVVLSVADNGCGMTPTFMKDSLFHPFQSTKAKGLGIGMFQSRMVVEAHGGSIQVDSETGKGTTVRVSLPVTKAMDAR